MFLELFNKLLGVGYVLVRVFDFSMEFFLGFFNYFFEVVEVGDYFVYSIFIVNVGLLF